MVEENRPQGGSAGDRPEDYQYYGPFGSSAQDSPDPSAADDGWSTGPDDAWQRGSVEHDDTQPIQRIDASYEPPTESTQVMPLAPGPSYSSYGDSSSGLYPAPAGVQPLQPRAPETIADSIATPTSARRPLRGVAVIAVAGITALVIGSAAGFGGAKLAGLDPVSGSTSASPAPATPTPGVTRAPVSPAPNQADVVEVAKTVLPSTVMIRAGGTGSGSSTGSGFVLDTDGRIMTNNHVVAGAADDGRLEVVFDDGSTERATLVGRSPSYDLAVIRVDPSPDLVPMRIGDSDGTRVGETVIAVGAPLALAGTVTSGIVSSKNRPVVVNGSGNADAASAYINAIQTDTSINPGNSGGPLVDGGARVIGVNSAILTLGQTSGQSGNIGLGFAIPINQAMDIGALLIKNGKATYPVIGANVAEADNGVRLTTVESDGPAADAGLREDDVVTGIDGVGVTDIEKLIVTIRTHRPGDVVELTYERGGRKSEAKVTLGSKEG